MASLPMRRCARCKRMVRGKCGYCRPSELRTQSKGDPFYSMAQWRRLRRYVLDCEPLCRHCREAGRTTAATEVDHILDRCDRPDLAMDFDNLQPLCKPCHSSKTGRTRAARRQGGRVVSREIAVKAEAGQAQKNRTQTPIG